MNLLLEIVLLGAVVVGIGFMVNRLVDSKFTSVEEEVKPEPEPEPVQKPKRARTAKGKFVADDPTTPGVNEAWVGGKAPKTNPKPKKKKTTKKKAVKRTSTKTK